MIGESKVNDFDVFYELIQFMAAGGERGRGGTVGIGPQHNHDILRFEIPMYNFQRMEVERRLYNLANNKRRNILRKPLPPLDILIQIIAVDILSNDVDVSLAADGLLVLDDLRVRDYLHYFTLVVQCGYRLRIQLLGADVLQGEGATRLLGGATVDD